MVIEMQLLFIALIFALVIGTILLLATVSLNFFNYFIFLLLISTVILLTLLTLSEIKEEEYSEEKIKKDMLDFWKQQNRK